MQRNISLDFEGGRGDAVATGNAAINAWTFVVCDRLKPRHD